MPGVILECDIGNTRCKWRLLSADGGIADSGRFAIEQGFAGLPSLVMVDRVRVACVADDQVVRQFLACFGEKGLEPEFAISSPRAAGVVNAYGDNAARLGVDRWLAVIAAFQRKAGAALVIDVGTALKADLVAADGHHLGGYIVPGAELMKTSLRLGTGKVRFTQQGHDTGLGFGCSTADAVHAGILASQVGAVNIAITEAKRRISEDFAILLTGGGAAAMVDHLQEEVIEVPDLVLDGLCWLLP